MDEHQQAEINKAIERGDFGKPDQFKINTTLDLMMRRTRKRDDVSVEYVSKPVFELPAKNPASLMEVSDSIAQALNPLPEKERKSILSKIDKQVKKSISDAQLTKFKALADIDPLAKAEIAERLESLSPSRRYVELIRYGNEQDRSLERTQAEQAALAHCFEWLERLKTIETYTLERNDVSRLHKYIEAGRSGRIIDISKEPSERRQTDGFIVPPQTFVVKHDWASAFSSASGLSDGIKLPYDVCGFEFRVCGHTVLVMAVECEPSEVYKDGVMLTALVECADHWMTISNPDGKGDPQDVLYFLWTQIRAICIALDAEVATDDVVRAPSALNIKREKAGKIPLRDYHVVDLSRRHRISNPLGGESGVRHRMHFVRGHWRHYETSKTWIKWHLRGDPDLGFIQKHYSL